LLADPLAINPTAKSRIADAMATKNIVEAGMRRKFSSSTAGEDRWLST
jgi:hypothetical protein